jgi:putative radical SAM enzyme (TIGR03279 family)
MAIIREIAVDSIASRTSIAPGDELRRVNGHDIADVLDYRYFSYDKNLFLELTSQSGRVKLVRLKKPEGADIGLEFETYLMDASRSCANRCVFCFIDQLPRGMRETLYYKDDDARLSFLQGNYITLTNMSEREIKRIIDLRISPLNVSVHSTQPEIRAMLLGNKNAGRGIETLKRLADGRITMNCQIVCCPGINDGERLRVSMEDLSKLYPFVGSVSIVPVGLTGHREGLYPLTPYDFALARETIAQVESFSEKCLERYGSRIFFCADELYIKARLKLPPDEFYEGYPQLDNGVGMMRLLITEFDDAIECGDSSDGADFSIATGVSAGKFIENLLYTAREKCDTISGKVYRVENTFFGGGVDVSGLVTGGDILRTLSGEALGKRLLIPRNMLRRGEDAFLDDVTTLELSRALGVEIRVVGQDGADLLAAMCGR